MKKKSMLTLIAVLVAGLSLFTVATLAAGNADAGYEKFKEIMKDIDHAEEGKVNATVTVTDNGNELMSADIEAVGAKDSDTGSGETVFTVDGVEKSFEFYKSEDALYLIDRNEDAYYKVVDSGEYDEYEDYEDYDRFDDKDHSMTAVEEELLDYFVGDLKDNFTVTENGDGTSISFAMEGAQVPEVLQLMVKAGSASEHRDMDRHDEEWAKDLPFMDGIDTDVMPDLVEDVKIDSMSIDITLDSASKVESFDMAIAVSGRDAAGVFHSVEVNVDSTFDDSVVTPEIIDVDAYDWEVIEHEEAGHAGSKHRR